MTEPIKPDDIEEARKKKIPDQVIECFNELIAQKWDGYRAQVVQTEVANMICSKMNITRGVLFESGYLDIESIYRKAGWEVIYYAPGYNEKYPATYTFKKN